jgi:putative spermidine/putrescine transport system ATP-binding protein
VPARRSSAATPGAEAANGISLEGLGVTFANAFVGLQPTSLHIPGGKFCTLLGPSGSGKTTLLRAIAGLVPPTSGRIVIGETDVTTLPVQARNIGFVFQNYALFPHMNVAQNIEYPLKLHGWSADERRARVEEILQLIEMPQVATRAVGELSGGQQQRVAIGRALAYRPALLLLDEPMGALDRRLRQQLGADLREIQQRTGITAVYVTHDQEEAFILSDTIAVMAQGSILQHATPTELYFHPNSRFVAEFLGEANFVAVSGLERGANGGLAALTAYGAVPVTDGRGDSQAQPQLVAVLRPEDVVLTDESSANAGFVPPIPVQIVKELFLGSRCRVTVRAPDGKQILVECAKEQVPAQERQAYIKWKLNAAVLVDR